MNNDESGSTLTKDHKALSPNSDLLGRLNAFLPQIKVANEQLATNGPQGESIVRIIDQKGGDNIEDSDEEGSSDESTISDSDSDGGQVIEMNVALGNFDHTIVAALDEEEKNDNCGDGNNSQVTISEGRFESIDESDKPTNTKKQILIQELI